MVIGSSEAHFRQSFSPVNVGLEFNYEEGERGELGGQKDKCCFKYNNTNSVILSALG